MTDKTALSNLKSQVGRQASPRKMTVSETAMKDFSVCVRATVGTTSHSPISTAVIPTFFTIFRQGEFEIMNAIGIQLPQVLHAEQGYVVNSPLLPGEEVEFTTRLASVVEKKGKTAKLAFMVFETEFVRTLDQVTVASARSTMVYRELNP
jgi:hypothetical protein